MSHEFPESIRALAEEHQADLLPVARATIVHVTSAAFRDPNGADSRHMTAAVNTVTATVQRGLPIVVMVDDMSPTGVAAQLREAGAIAVTAPPLMPATVGGALLVAYMNSQAGVVFSGITHAIGSEAGFFGRVGRNLQTHHCVFGQRDLNTWGTMPPVRRYVEARIAAVAYSVLQVSRDATSGIYALRGRALEFYTSFGNDHLDDLWRPARVARQCLGARLNVGNVDVSFAYPAEADATLEQVLRHLVELPRVIGDMLVVSGRDIVPLTNEGADTSIAQLTELVQTAAQFGDPHKLRELVALARQFDGVPLEVMPADLAKSQ